ncbi:MAG: phospho-N-acetylmuramoyl-pentapeptide-transferase [Chitinophagales bacterium]|nr:phospho-N-acetylmuramoyl-pentapeptide-transferase [Chitinophagales bacterium]OJV24223.1 MAG: phospho-N-acetylmuramoyl-pentapeptide-transferase [Bacteroidetes bacterium 37-13]HRN93539.1 phospho-N-acetylmuramoyl-pentapeptide-transferase [Chitinophagales bacterium]HRP40002.1 phospho-N-acetylmuramoyl-pentapeptide-transferase [Chitinophagales bacterium]
MLYYLFRWLDVQYDFPGAGLFNYISFRAAMALLLSLVISLVYGKNIIDFLRKKQIGETIRELGLEGEKTKKGTPTMGGLIILSAILIPTLLFAKIGSVYIILLLITTVWLGIIGALDDYIKVFKKDKKGLSGKFKIIGQVGLGIIVGTVLYFNGNVVIKDEIPTGEVYKYDSNEVTKVTDDKGVAHYMITEKSTITTLPFIKNQEIDYERILGSINEEWTKYTWLIFIPIVIFIITAVSNAANLTDGIDGLAAGSASIIGATLLVFAYVSGNIIFADYLNIMYIPNVGELVIFCAAFIGACVGFLWYNAYPAQVFMGDTGSLALGGIIATMALCVRKELLLPLICGVFLVETVSVMMQVSYFKYTKRKYGEGRRIFLMSPLHHHFQKMGIHESKIVSRFWIIGIMLAVLSIVTLKIQ